MTTNTTPEPLTFSELYDAKVACIRQIAEADKNLKRLHKSGGHTRATDSAILRWEDTKSKYTDLTNRLHEFIEVKLAENDERPAVPDQVPFTVPDSRGNRVRVEGVDRCDNCGCKYWENDFCIDCGGTEVKDEGAL